MAFYVGRIIREPATGNPTLVVLTDRNDLDDQLFGTFSRCQGLLRPLSDRRNIVVNADRVAGREHARGLR